MPKTTEQTRKRKKHKKHMNPFLRMALLLVILIAAFIFLDSSFFYVQDFEINGNKYYTNSQIKDLCDIGTGKNIVFETNLKTARNNLLESPYIKFVTITRKLPGTIVIDVEERREFAAVLSGERYIVIDEEGLVLRSTNVDPVLPIITGLKVKSSPEGSPLETVQSYLLVKSLSLLAAAEKNDFYFQRLELSSISVKAYMDYDVYYCEGDFDNLVKYIAKIKAVVANQQGEKITRGRMIVYSNGDIVLDP